jgi:hypothetical protein
MGGAKKAQWLIKESSWPPTGSGQFDNLQLAHWEVRYISGYQRGAVNECHCRNDGIGRRECDSSTGESKTPLAGLAA